MALPLGHAHTHNPARQRVFLILSQPFRTFKFTLFDANGFRLLNDLAHDIVTLNLTQFAPYAAAARCYRHATLSSAAGTVLRNRTVHVFAGGELALSSVHAGTVAVPEGLGSAQGAVWQPSQPDMPPGGSGLQILLHDARRPMPLPQ